MRTALASLALVSGLLVACSSSDPSPGAIASDVTATGGGAGGAGGATSAGGAGGAAPKGDLVGDVRRYTLAVDLETRALDSRLDLEVGTPGGDCASVPCAPEATGVTWDGAPATSATSEGGALAACGAGKSPGEALVLGATTQIPKAMKYGLDVGFSTRKDKFGGTFTYLLSWVGGCSTFGPCDADPSRLVAFDVAITKPGPGASLCAGTLVTTATGARCTLEGTLAPTYSAYFAAHDTLWERTPFVSAAGVDVVFYEPPASHVRDAVDAESTKAFLAWITDLLGPFPYGKELRFATAPTGWLGFEHPANVILSEDVEGATGAYAAPAVHVAMHEIVHQWAGDRSTIATAEDFVWKEATAEYLSYVFEDEHRPPGEAAASLAYWDAVSLQSAHYPRPTDQPPPAVQSFYGDVYGPGPMVLYVQLESLFGRPAVLAAIQAFLADPGARGVDDLRVALEAKAGADLGPYFDAWVFGAGAPEWPTFAVATDAVGDDVTVTVTQQSPSGTLYGCAVDVLVKGASTSAVAHVSFGAAPEQASASATVKLGEPVVATVIDPGHRLVARAAGAPKTPIAPRRVYIL